MEFAQDLILLVEEGDDPRQEPDDPHRGRYGALKALPHWTEAAGSSASQKAVDPLRGQRVTGTTTLPDHRKRQVQPHARSRATP